MSRTLKAVKSVLPETVSIPLQDREIREYLEKFSTSDLQTEIVNLLRIGVLSVTRANTNKEIDYWEKRSQNLQVSIEKCFTDIIQQDFIPKITSLVGSKEGQLLAPISNQIETTTKFIDRSLASNETRVKSMVSDLTKSLSSGTLSETLGKALSKEIVPLINEIRALSNYVAEQKGENTIKQSTTLKGRDYEQFVLEQVAVWAKYNKFTVENVGTDNRPGDILLESLRDKIRIVIEVKDISTRKGNSVLTREMGQAIQERKATIGIFITKTIEGLAKELGSYGEGISDGKKWIATTGDSLEIALNHCLVEERLRLNNEKNPIITNSLKIKENLDLARTLLSNMSAHYRNITEIKKSADNLEAGLRQTNSDILLALNTANSLITIQN